MNLSDLLAPELPGCFRFIAPLGPIVVFGPCESHGPFKFHGPSGPLGHFRHSHSMYTGFLPNATFGPGEKSH